MSEMTENVKNYLQLRIDLMMLKLTGKAAQLVSSLMLTVIFFILFLLLTVFISLAFIFWYKENIGSGWAACLIITGFYLLVGLIIYLLRTKLFVNPILIQLSKAILEEDHEHEI